MKTKDECDLCKATVQMDVLNRICSFGGMDLETAICELQLDQEKYARLAKREGLEKVATEIRALIRRLK